MLDGETKHDANQHAQAVAGEDSVTDASNLKGDGR
jgi:hypothetical protein